MEKRKQLRKRRKIRCSTEPPLPLVCCQSPGDLTVPSPDLLNVSWTWDVRGPRRPRTLKRHPTVLASMRKRPNFRKPRSGLKPKHGFHGSSQCSSEQSSEYFDAVPDQRETEKWDDDWPNELEYFTDADDGMNQVHLYEQRRLDTITKTYSHFYDSNENRSTRVPSKVHDQSNNSETDIWSLSSAASKSKTNNSGPLSLAPGCGQKKKFSPYIDAVAKVLQWTTRKSPETLPTSNQDSVAKRRHSLLAMDDDLPLLEKDINLKKNSSNTLPSQVLRRHKEELQPVDALPTVTWTPCQKKAQRDVRRFIKKIYKGMLDRAGKSDKFSTEYGLQKDGGENDSIFALLDQKADSGQKNVTNGCRKNSLTHDCDVARRKRSNGWKTKYKKSTWSSTEWHYTDVPPQDSCEQNTKETASDLRRNSSANSYINESPFSKRSNLPVRDKVEFFDIRSLSDDNSNVSPPYPCTVVVTDCDVKDRSPTSEIDEHTNEKYEADDASKGKYPISTPPPSPLLQKFLLPFRDASVSRGSLSAGSDDSHSAAHSSDCEDGEKSDSASLMDRFRGLRKDMQKKISKVKSPRGAPYGTNDDGQLGMRAPDARPRPPHGPVDAAADRVVLRKRLNSGGPLSTSPPPPAPYTGPFIGRAVALTDFQPSPYDVDLLKFNKGDVIDIISKSPSGQWRGCVDGRVGEFKFILVEEETERDRLHRKLRGQRSSPLEQFPHASVEALFRHFKLSHLLQIFILHGYETLDQFREVDEQDLDNLGIRDPETREKLLAAVASILEYEQNSIVGHVSEASVANNTSSSSRDSGCFTDQKAVSNCLVPDSEGSHTDGRQSSPSTDNSSGYQGRGNYIMSHAGEVSSTLQEVPDTTLDSSSSTEEDVTSKESNQLVIASHSQQRDLNMRSSDKGEPDSYRATPALVMPGTPEDSPQLRRKLDDDNVIASARCSSDTGVSVQSSSSEAVVPSHHGDG